jgi:hypothetical protein
MFVRASSYVVLVRRLRATAARQEKLASKSGLTAHASVP